MPCTVQPPVRVLHRLVLPTMLCKSGKFHAIHGLRRSNISYVVLTQAMYLRNEVLHGDMTKYQCMCAKLQYYFICARPLTHSQ